VAHRANLSAIHTRSDAVLLTFCWAAAAAAALTYLNDSYCEADSQLNPVACSRRAHQPPR